MFFLQFAAKIYNHQMEEVVLVDSSGSAIGLMEKLEAHEKGLLHRAFSVFILNNNGELMLQQRALHKYHSGALWTKTCCSHPRDQEEILEAGQRRLQEEMGFSCSLKECFTFTYKAYFENGLIKLLQSSTVNH